MSGEQEETVGNTAEMDQLSGGKHAIYTHYMKINYLVTELRSEVRRRSSSVS